MVRTCEAGDAGLAVDVDPVLAGLRVEVLAPVLVEAAAAAHGFRHCKH